VRVHAGAIITGRERGGGERGEGEREGRGRERGGGERGRDSGEREMGKRERARQREREREEKERCASVSALRAFHACMHAHQAFELTRTYHRPPTYKSYAHKR